MRGLPIVAIFLILSFSTCPVTADSTIEMRGGGSVVMEQATATWCDVCASHESWISPMVESNGERLIRVSLHSSIDDPLGNEASKFRRNWLGHTDSDPTPIYHFDGVRENTPSSSRGELQRSLLDAEGDRVSHESLDVSIIFESSSVFIEAIIDDPIKKNGTIMTLMLLKSEASIDPEDATNGLLTSHSVLQQIVMIGENTSSIYPVGWATGTIDYEIGIKANFSFEWPNGMDKNSTTIVVIHEEGNANSGHTTLSALSWNVIPSEQESNSSLWPAVVGIGVIIAGLAYKSQRKLQ